MAYTHEGWTLYKRDVTLKGGRNQTIYFLVRGHLKVELPVIYQMDIQLE